MKFTDKLADFILEENYKLEDLTIILPSERAIKYLRSSLYSKAGRPLISPKIKTINSWVKELCPMTVVDSTRALIKLFSIQLEQAKNDEDKSFDEFLSWGNILLSDYNEIDRHMLDVKDVFKNLAQIKELESWNVSPEELSSAQKRFLEFWDKLAPFYFRLDEILEDQNLCLPGKAARIVAESPNLLFSENAKEQYIFAGFNALSPAEMSIIHQLDQMGRGQVLVDADEFYYENKHHEAGSFLRKLSSRLGKKRMGFIGDELRNKDLKVGFIECAQQTGQVKATSTLLQTMTQDQMEETLLLLADETLISSLLKNLPANIQKANITLGLPIKTSAIKTWMELIFSIQENKHRFRTDAIYHKDFQNFSWHPFIHACSSEGDLQLINVIERSIIKYNKIFLSGTKLNVGKETADIIDLLFTDWESDWLKATRSIRSLNRILYSRLSSEDAFEKALLECFDQSLLEFENIAQEHLPQMSLKSFKMLFNQHWTSKSVAYHGNPIDGLQIMGLLETRCLDFKRIIAIGMNEGNLPPTNPIQTIIPMDLRKYLGLPTPREKQGLFAHHFYRLLHECSELTAIYCTASEQIGSNEKSRYLAQLQLELAPFNRKVVIDEKVYSVKSELKEPSSNFIKTEAIIQKLDSVFERSTSPSLVRKFLDCPLDFYFRYVMDFGESEDIEEEIENSTFGTFIHETLETLYKPFSRRDKHGNINKPAPSNIMSVDVERMLKEYAPILNESFLKHFNGDRNAFRTGKNKLSYEMAKTLIERFLKSEIEFLTLQTEDVYIEALELNLQHELCLSIYGEDKVITLNGFVDRIDSVGGKIRIIDYKSGKVKQDELTLRKTDLETEQIIESIGNKKHIFQLMLYSYLFFQIENEVAMPGIISLVSKDNKPLFLDTKNIPLVQIIEDFPVYLQGILEEVYNPAIPFEHKSKGMFSYCNYCE